jgi:hypothetical protein
MLRVFDYDWDYGDIGGGEVGCTDLKVFGMYDRGELHKVGNLFYSTLVSTMSRKFGSHL